MCGIAGAINYKKYNLNEAQKSLLHRGPDEQSKFYHQNVAFVHTRLAIQDIKMGKQPMHYGPYTIVFDGALYNHLELRKNLEDTFSTQSDAETLLHLYAKYKEKCLDMLDGMFAFAILDKEKGEIFLARDRVGGKPLYIYKDADSLLFASELNAIREAIKLQIDSEKIYNYVRTGFFYKTNTPYKNITAVEAGTFAKVNINALNIKVEKWWNVFDYYSNPLEVSFDSALRQVEHLLQQSVKSRLEGSDLEVGAFLSGGIDSSLITAIASRCKKKLKTFTVSFEGSYDETPLARLVAEKYDTDHTELSISFDNLQDDLEKILLNYGEPFADNSAVPSYYVSREAKKYLKLVLNGDGGDEIFGGYRRYVPFTRVDFFGLPFVVKWLANIANFVFPISHDKKSIYNYLYRLSQLAGKKGVTCYYSATTDLMEGFQENILTDDSYLDDARKDFEFINNSGVSGLRKIMTMDFNTLLCGPLFVKMDIAAMANSLVLRCPFLSKDLLEYVPRLPDRYKVANKTTKYILRELAKKYLPKELINQPKRGFEVPLKKWIENDLKDIVFGYLDGNCYCQNFIKRKFVSDLLLSLIHISEPTRPY